MSAKYTYSNTDFLNSKINTESLSYQIEMSTLSGLEYININDQSCDIWFTDYLSSEEEATLSGIVNFHDGTSLLKGIKQQNIELFVLSNRSVMATTSEDWKTIAKKQNCFLSGGTYRVAWSYFWKALTDDQNPYIEVRAFVSPINYIIGNDDEEIINIDFIGQAKGIFYQKILSYGSSSQAIPESGFTYLPLQTGKYDIYIQYRRTGSFGTVAIANSNLELLKATDGVIGSNLGCCGLDLINYNYDSSTSSGTITALDSFGDGLSEVQILLIYNTTEYNTNWYTDANGEYSLKDYLEIYNSNDFDFKFKYNNITYGPIDDHDWHEGIIIQTGRAVSSSQTCSAFVPSISGMPIQDHDIMSFYNDIDMELFPGSYIFMFNDGFDNTEYTISGGAATYIH